MASGLGSLAENTHYASNVATRALQASRMEVSREKFSLYWGAAS